MTSQELLERVLAIIDTHKAEEVVAFDVQELVTYTDYVVICSGQNSRQVDAITSHLLTDLKKEGVLPLGVEGRSEGEWVLADFGDVVVHVMDDPVRAFYNLEGLWGDAPRMPVPNARPAAYAAH